MERTRAGQPAWPIVVLLNWSSAAALAAVCRFKQTGSTAISSFRPVHGGRNGKTLNGSCGTQFLFHFLLISDYSCCISA